MAGNGSEKAVSAGGILNINRDNEILQRFVRVNLEEGDEEAAGAAKSRRKQRKLPPVRRDRTPEEPVGRYQARESSLEVGTLRSLCKELGARGAETGKGSGKRFRRRGIRYEECYTDKDRAAAVNMGSRDIKHSLKIKRKQDRSKALQIPEEAHPATFLALGKYEMRRGDPDIAVDFISKVPEVVAETFDLPACLVAFF